MSADASVNSGRIRIVHIIIGLDTGGAETMLFKLLSNIDRQLFAPAVVSLTDIGPIGEKLISLGLPVKALGMRAGLPKPGDLLRLKRIIEEWRPDLIQTWMYHSDLIGGFVARWAGIKKVIWNIRASRLEPDAIKRSTIWIASLCARLSRRLPAKIICCSEASVVVHSQLGYDTGKMTVIPNGFDLAAFKPNPEARRSVRDELGLSAEAQLIGLVGRFDPMKDHRNFVQAAGLLHQQRPETHFLLCGNGIDWQNDELRGWIEQQGIRERCHLLGRRDDIPRINAALDIATTSSSGEGFPNVIGEAMACGIPFVATDVGDSALIIGDTGRVVPPRNPQALSAAWHEMLSLSQDRREALGRAARERIEKNFDLPLIVSKYESVYKGMIG